MGAGDGGEVAGGLEFLECGDGIGVGEGVGVVVVGGAAGGVVDPPGGFERDAVGVGEVDGADGVVVDDVADFAVGAFEASLEVDERCLRRGG